MAVTSKSRPWSCIQEHGAELAACHCRPDFFTSGLSFRSGRIPWACSHLKIGKRNLGSFGVKGYGLEAEVQHVQHEGEGYYIPEEEKNFVKALQEAQPYVQLYRGSTFVLVVSGELQATPSLDTILKTVKHLNSLGKAQETKSSRKSPILYSRASIDPSLQPIYCTEDAI